MRLRPCPRKVTGRRQAPKGPSRSHPRHIFTLAAPSAFLPRVFNAPQAGAATSFGRARAYCRRCALESPTTARNGNCSIPDRRCWSHRALAARWQACRQARDPPVVCLAASQCIANSPWHDLPAPS